jgi:hypothetical protein
VRRRAGAALAAMAAVAVIVSGCGSGSLSAAQLRNLAQRACTGAARRLNRIPAPRTPSDAEAFLRRGVSALQPEMTALDRLSPSPELASHYERARSATRREVDALRSTIKGLKAGNDPAVAIKTLQQDLLPLERRARAAWRALGVPSCFRLDN